MRRFLFSAWGISLGVHLVALALVAVVRCRRGRAAPGDGNTHSMGIVLNHSGDDGELRNGDDGEGDKLSRWKSFRKRRSCCRRRCRSRRLRP